MSHGDYQRQMEAGEKRHDNKLRQLALNIFYFLVASGVLVILWYALKFLATISDEPPNPNV